MDLIYEENVAWRKICKDRSEVTNLFNSRAGSNFHLTAGFFGNQVSQGGFTQARRTVEKNMLGDMPPLLGCPEEDFYVVFYMFLANILLPLKRTKSTVQE